MSKKAVFFIHGLGGSESTWGKFPELIASDDGLDWDTFHFTYPTPPLGLRFFPFLQKNYKPIEILSQSLKTEIDNQLGDYDEIALVGHSLGGLVIRRYLLGEEIARRQTKIDKVILYATPNTGSALALISREFSLGENGHTRQLCKKSDFLNLLNRDWASSGIEDNLDITIVVGGDDSIVSQESAEANFRTRNREPQLILEAGHINIVKPKSETDIRYLILKNALKKKRRLIQQRWEGALSFDEWAKYGHTKTLPFRVDTTRQANLNQIREHFGNYKRTLRVVGLSGLGKTRLVFEAANQLEQGQRDDICYFDAASETINLTALLKNAIRKGCDGTLIVDNCSADMHEKLRQEVEREDSSICLITIDYSPQSVQDVPMIRLERFSDEDISKILEPAYQDKLSALDMQKIAAFAQGFPQMAVLLAKARLSDDPSLGILTDDGIAQKLLWGNETPSAEQERILQGCALFEIFGVEDEVSAQLEFIATTVLGINHEVVHRCVQDFSDRGLIDRRGRFAQLVPKPLAVRLAAAWWKREIKTRQLSVIEKLPQSMESSFCSQISRMDTLPRVKELTAQLCGQQGPFGSAEVIFSRKGSMLFRALVEVNPEVTADLINRIITPATDEMLTSINGDTRRNLVWALEKLSIRRETFDRASFCLLRLAAEENESWSNNATGQFKQLFRLQLSGVQAPPEQRFNFLRTVLAMDEVKYTALAVEALAAALDLNGNIRTVGAEYQGINTKLEEWQPSTWEDIFAYLGECLSTLRELLKLSSAPHSRIKSAIGSNIRQLIGFNQGQNLNDVISEVLELDGPFWPEALDSIKCSLEYDNEHLRIEDIQYLERWLPLLDGRSGRLEDRLRILVLEPPFEHREVNDEFIDVAAMKAAGLAKEIVRDHTNLDATVNFLIGDGMHRQTHAFGQALADESNEAYTLAREILAKTIARMNTSTRLLLGVLSGLFKKSPENWRLLVDELMQNPDRADLFLPDVLITGKIETTDLRRLSILVEQGELDVLRLRGLSYGSVLKHLEPEPVCDLALCLVKLPERETNSWLALDLLFMYCHGDDNRRVRCKNAFQVICLACGLGNESSQKYFHEWNRICSQLCVDDAEFRSQLTEKILRSIGADNLSFDTISEFKSAMCSVLKNMNSPTAGTKDELTLQKLEACISNASGLAYLHLLWIFEGERKMNTGKGESLFGIISVPTVLDWCEKHSAILPFFVARSAQVIVEVDKNLTVNPLLVTLLAKYGEDDNLGSEIEANLNTRTWGGSLAPILSRERDVIHKLVSHENSRVRQWAARYLAKLASRINGESRRDDERVFGIY